MSHADVTTPAWGVSPERYEINTAEYVCNAGLEDLPSPVVALVPNGQRVLDLGCGTGHTARLLTQRGCTVVGVEVDERAAVSAGAWCERVVLCDLDVTRLDEVLHGEQFDVVVAGDVLEHLRDPAAVLRSVALLLAEHGMVVASVPNVAHGSIRLALLEGSFDYADQGLLDRTHLRFFTATSVQRLFESAGYVIERNDRIWAAVDEREREDLPPGIAKAVALLPEATTWSFLLVARPTPEARTRELPLATGAEAATRSIAPMEAEAMREKDRLIARQQVWLANYASLREEAEVLRAELESPVWKTWVRVRPVVRPVARKSRTVLRKLIGAARR